MKFKTSFSSPALFTVYLNSELVVQVRLMMKSLDQFNETGG